MAIDILLKFISNQITNKANECLTLGQICTVDQAWYLGQGQYLRQVWYLGQV